MLFNRQSAIVNRQSPATCAALPAEKFFQKIDEDYAWMDPPGGKPAEAGSSGGVGRPPPRPKRPGLNPDFVGTKARERACCQKASGARGKVFFTFFGRSRLTADLSPGEDAETAERRRGLRQNDKDFPLRTRARQHLGETIGWAVGGWKKGEAQKCRQDKDLREVSALRPAGRVLRRVALVLPPDLAFLPSSTLGLPASSFGLPASSFGLPASSFRLPASSFGLRRDKSP